MTERTRRWVLGGIGMGLAAVAWPGLAGAAGGKAMGAIVGSEQMQEDRTAPGVDTRCLACAKHFLNSHCQHRRIGWVVVQANRASARHDHALWRKLVELRQHVVSTQPCQDMTEIHPSQV